MAEYRPPIGTSLPFNFTESGYAPPNSTSTLFNFTRQGSFGTLAAAVNVTQPHWEAAYTYPKSCPKYVIAYGPGQVQIIKGRCQYGGIRDLRGTITGIEYGVATGSLTASIDSVLRSGQSGISGYLRVAEPSNLQGIIDTHAPEDLSAQLTAEKRHGSSDINALVSTHTPRDLGSVIATHHPKDVQAAIRGWYREATSDLTANLRGWQQGNIPAEIGGHTAGNLGVLLKAWQYEAHNDLPASLYGWQQGQLPASLSVHTPADIGVILRGWQRGAISNLQATLRGYTTIGLPSEIGTHLPKDVKASIRGWYRGVTSDLTAVIRMWQQENLTANVGTHPWSDLSAIVMPHPPPPLPATIRGWARGVQKDLQASLYGWQSGNLTATVGAHTAGNLGVILRSWVRSAQENLSGSIYGWQQTELPASINPHIYGELKVLLKGVALGVPTDLPASLYGWQEHNLTANVGAHRPANLIGHIRSAFKSASDIAASLHGWQATDLPAIIGTHSPGNLSATIRMIYGVHSDLSASTYGYDSAYLSSNIDTHLPGNIAAQIKVSAKEYGTVGGLIYGWATQNLGVYTDGGHSPVDLRFSIFTKQAKLSNISAQVRGWQAGNLSATTNIVYPITLPASLLAVQPKNLPAYLNIIAREDLSASIGGWDTAYLGASIKRIYDVLLPGTINGVTDTFKGLRAMIFGYGEGQSDLSATARALIYQSLGGYIYSRYKGDLPTYCNAIPPRNLRADLHGWQELNLQGILNGVDYPWNLTAEINPTGSWKTLPAYLFAVQGSVNTSSLVGRVSSWQAGYLASSIYGANAGILNAFINPYLQAGDLHASISPKMIRLTTIIKVPTLVGRDLSAVINYSCFKTGYSSLSSSIYAKFKGDLYAYIKGIVREWTPYNLSAKIGYSDSYLEVDKLNISITISQSMYWEEDRYKLYLNVLRGGNLLNAYIRGTLRYKDLGAEVIGEAIPSYVYKSALKNREKVIHTTYDGVYKTFETVEMAFKSIVEDYYYSSQGDYAWKADRFARWSFDVRSMLPASESLKLSRRLHRATTLFDLRKYDTVDAAIRKAIAYVTEYPKSNLGAVIYNRSTFIQLPATIYPRYSKDGRGTLLSSITVKEPTFVISNNNSVTKL